MRGDNQPVKLHEDDVQSIADIVAKQVIESKSGFLVPPEKHYNDHRRLGELLDAMDDAKGIFTKAILVLAVAGLLFLVYLGFNYAPSGKIKI